MTRKTEQVDDSSAETDSRIPNARDQASPFSISITGVITQKRFRKNSKPLSKPRRFFPITVSKTVSMKIFTGYPIIKVMVEQNRFIVGFY